MYNIVDVIMKDVHVLFTAIQVNLLKTQHFKHTIGKPSEIVCNLKNALGMYTASDRLLCQGLSVSYSYISCSFFL